MLLLSGENMYLLKFYKKASGVNLLSPTNIVEDDTFMIFGRKIDMKEKFYDTIPSYKNAQRCRFRGIVP